MLTENCEIFHVRPESSIADFAIIGNGQTAALVDRRGSIDWCCWPRFDSPAVFCRLLDAERGSFFQIAPPQPFEVTRTYVGETNILMTTFSTATGQVRNQDFMPAPDDEDRQSIPHRILRKIQGLRGSVELEVTFRPSFNFAQANAEFFCDSRGARAISEQGALSLVCPIPLQKQAEALVGRRVIEAGDELWIALTHCPPNDAEAHLDFTVDEAESEYHRTQDYWQRWLSKCIYDGPDQQLVRRSLLALKLLFFHPSGGLVAAPTTSLPEDIGGVRNWDYRYTWLRDSGLMLDVLQQLGYHDESLQFIDWLERLHTDEQTNLKIMYTVDGTTVPSERELDHLAGYRGSRPVRVGNAAADQIQLDVYGHVIDAVVLCIERMPRPVRPELWELLTAWADQAATHWRQPDRGPWEVRGEPQHFLYSKLYCWVALDRAVRLAEDNKLVGPLDRWRNERDAIRQAILAQGFHKELQSFTQTLDGATVDASVLTLPLNNFLSASDPRMLSTIQCVQSRLMDGGLLSRYTEDSLPGTEGAFVLCCFWLVSNLALADCVEDARQLFDHVCGFANDVGLLAEEIDPDTGELLGNFPQGFAHLGLIRAALHLAEAERRNSI